MLQESTELKSIKCLVDNLRTKIWVSWSTWKKESLFSPNEDMDIFSSFCLRIKKAKCIDCQYTLLQKSKVGPKDKNLFYGKFFQFFHIFQGPIMCEQCNLKEQYCLRELKTWESYIKIYCFLSWLVWTELRLWKVLVSSFCVSLFSEAAFFHFIFYFLTAFF